MRMIPPYLPLFAIVFIILARRPLHMLRKVGATSPEKAQRLDDLNSRDRARLDRLIAKGIVRERAAGEYYYDLDAERAVVRKRMPWVLGLVAVLALAALALWYYNNHNVAPLP